LTVGFGWTDEMSVRRVAWRTSTSWLVLAALAGVRRLVRFGVFPTSAFYVTDSVQAA
jgi:hypothetical protein